MRQNIYSLALVPRNVHDPSGYGTSIRPDTNTLRMAGGKESYVFITIVVKCHAAGQRLDNSR